MPASFRPLDTLLPRAVAAYGGKADTLASLARNGFAVPRCFALSGEASRAHYERVLPEPLQPQNLLVQRVVAEEQIAEARERLLAAPLSAQLVRGVAGVLRELDSTGTMGVAVRSSNLTAQQDLAAVAGLEETWLGVRGVEAVCAAIVRSWSNLFNPRVLGYLQRLGGPSAYATGIMLQVMLPAEISGVMFTENPLTGDPNELVIDATYGLGTVLVSGSVAADTYRIERETGWVRDRVLGEKSFREDAVQAAGLQRTKVAPEIAQRFSLMEHQLGRLVDLAQRLERHFGAACETHWAIVEDQLYVLRARASNVNGDKRGARQRSRKAHDEHVDPVDIVWSNSHVAELLPGVSTPLTWSIAKRFSEEGFHALFQGLGCSVTKHAPLLGNFRGRPYLNLTEVAEITAQMPGLGPQAVLPLSSAHAVAQYAHASTETATWNTIVRAPLIASRLSAQHLKLKPRVLRFERVFSEEHRRLRALDLRILPGAALDATMSDVHQLLHDAGTLLATVYGALVLTQVPLHSMLVSLFGDDAQGIAWDLLSALEDPAEDADPARALVRVATLLEDDQSARDWLLAPDATRDFQDFPQGAARDALHQYLSGFGHLSLRAFEVSQPRYREEPRLVLDALRAHVQTKGVTRDLYAKGRRRLLAAEKRLAALSIPQRALLRGLLTVTRHYLRLRRQVHRCLSQVFDMLRWVVLDAARRLEVREPECGPEATFFLHIRELHAVLRGDLNTVAPLIHRRRAQMARDAELPAPPHTFVGYPRPAEAEEPQGARFLSGLSASSGVIEARACLLSDIQDGAIFGAGDVLVVPAADAGLVPLLTAASALVAEVGCPLSPLSGVARELGLPAVVQVEGAQRVISTGDIVRVDGNAGTVALL